MASAVPRPHPNGDNTEYKKIKNICSICEISVRLNKTFCVRLNITLRVGFSKLSARHAASVAALLDLMGVYEKSPEPFQARGSGGGYLLSHFRSTIGAAGFNFSVRNGKRWNPRAMAALISLKKEHYTGSFLLPVRSACGWRLWRLLSLLCLNGFL